ncbi:ubiquitin [Artemisia annua]|uniref:Ubiquitin n=1 Tax=Artemisia annua TaxID=35608 RepID=A0A2U1QGF0_ARTAN|nr:ubiquitin [Artemisia annua]
MCNFPQPSNPSTPSAECHKKTTGEMMASLFQPVKRKRNDDDDYLLDDSLNTISVKTFTGETYSLQVKGSDTVASVKFKMRDILKIPHDEQALVYDEMVLEDMITLADVYVKKDSTLTLMRKSSGWVSLVINDRNGQRHCSMNVKLSDTIGNLKANIPSIDPQNKELVFNDMVLDDTCILANLPIMADSILTLMGNSKIRARRIEILVKTLTGKTISLDVKPLTPIGHVKTHISYLEHIPVDEQVLIFNEMVLDDSGIMFDFGIKKGSTLTLMRVSKGLGLMKIIVRTLNGMENSMEVKPSDTIGKLKTRIHKKEGIPNDEQVLIFNEMVLHDSGTLIEFCIKHGSFLTLMRKSRGFIKIFFRCLTDQTFSLEVKPLYTIAYIKAKIQDEFGLRPEQQRLIFEGKQLSEDSHHTIGEYNIPNGSTIDVLPWGV